MKKPLDFATVTAKFEAYEVRKGGERRKREREREREREKGRREGGKEGRREGGRDGEWGERREGGEGGRNVINFVP